jgi:hypothetical protein
MFDLLLPLTLQFSNMERCFTPLHSIRVRTQEYYFNEIYMGVKINGDSSLVGPPFILAPIYAAGVKSFNPGMRMPTARLKANRWNMKLEARL